ncbi:MAG: sulfur oxidation c-type cytochrome SoxX [Gammaproteobacteria bacterium]
MLNLAKTKCNILIICIFAAISSISYADGKQLAFDRTKGNCLACHAIEGGESPGNIGPALINMKQRYPDKSLLRQRIWDETQFNPITVMPPFGKHRILTEEEIDQVVDFIHAL